MPNSLELNVSPAQLHTFANHPFHVRKDMEMNELVDSIRESGVIVPLIVRSRPEGGYEIISGHRRCEACRELGIEKVPVHVLKEGRLIQQGSYDELFNQDNLFKELVENQRNLERIIVNEK